MTESSYFWGGISVGDATLAPYDDDEFTDRIRELIMYDRTVQGILFRSNDSGLPITNPSGLTIRLGIGRALVDGKVYLNTADLDLTLSAAPGAGTDYYHVVLRKDFATQTVRAVLVGPVNGGPATPAVQNDGVIWEIVLAEVRQTSGGVITVYDKRISIHAGPIFIERHIALTSENTLTFDNIPTFYRKLIIEGWIRTNNDVAPASAGLTLQFNNDTGANYDYHTQNFATGGITVTNATGQTSARVGALSENSSVTGPDKMSKVYIEIIQDLSGLSSSVIVESRLNASVSQLFYLGFAEWHDAGPVAEIDIAQGAATWEVGSIWTLYGVP